MSPSDTLAAAVAPGGMTERVVLTVIIPSYNARDLLADCLDSIYRSPPSEPYEVIVIDDASSDGTSDLVRGQFPEVRLLRNEINRHYAYSNNRAMLQARGEFIHLLNNDTIVLPGALDAMIAFLRATPEAGVVGCKLLNGDGTIQWSVKSLPNPGSALFGARSIITRLYPNNRFSREHLQHMSRDLSRPFVAGYVSSAAMMLPRPVIDRVGGLDERLSYHVDADYCKRVADAGYKTYYLPTAAIIHLDHKGGTMVSLRRRFRSLVEFHRGSYIFYRKQMQTSALSPMHGVVVAGLTARFVLSVTVRLLAELRAAIGRSARHDPAPRPAFAARDAGSSGPGVTFGRGAGLPIPQRTARILAHIHTFNDADIIDRTIASVRAQSHAVDEILVVDNASKDATLDQPQVTHATVLRQRVNGGTSGAVNAGFRYALEHDYDWLWVFDADSTPEPDALDKLLALYAGLPDNVRDETAFLACLPRNLANGEPMHGGIFTKDRLAAARPAPGENYYACHFTIWSGILYRLAAVRDIGIPNPDYVLDWGEYEYAYRVMKAGYKAFICVDAVLHHNIRGFTSAMPKQVKLGPATFTIQEFPPIRCYYTCRNFIYFALYDFLEERYALLRHMGWGVFLLPVNFLPSPVKHAKQIRACLKGLWHGATGNILARY